MQQSLRGGSGGSSNDCGDGGVGCGSTVAAAGVDGGCGCCCSCTGRSSVGGACSHSRRRAAAGCSGSAAASRAPTRAHFTPAPRATSRPPPSPYRMFEVARTVHGDLDALSSEEDTASACALLCAFLDKASVVVERGGGSQLGRRALGSGRGCRAHCCSGVATHPPLTLAVMKRGVGRRACGALPTRRRWHHRAQWRL